MSPVDSIAPDSVRRLATEAGWKWAIVIGAVEGGTRFLTWGKSPEDKVYASDLAEHIGQELCGPVTEVYESFKLDAAKNKAEVERLTDRVGNLIAVLIDVREFFAQVVPDGNGESSLDLRLAGIGGAFVARKVGEAIEKVGAL